MKFKKNLQRSFTERETALGFGAVQQVQFALDSHWFSPDVVKDGRGIDAQSIIVDCSWM